MNEIEKLYENAGVEECNSRLKEIMPSICLKNNKDENYKCEDCEYNFYPDFTTEKQIVILMFILNKYGDIGFQKMYSIRGNDESTRKDFIKCLCDCEHETFDSRPVDFYYQKGASGDNFEESLAALINSLWQDLTEQEQQQIKEILK